MKEQFKKLIFKKGKLVIKFHYFVGAIAESLETSFCSI